VLTRRAALRLDANNRAGARTDADAGSAAAPAQADLRIELGQIYTDPDRFDAAIVDNDK